MAFNLEIGDHFTIRLLRQALGSAVVPNDQEHLNRRFRELRSDGWTVPSSKDDRTLTPGTYRLEVKGWDPSQGARPRRNTVSERDRFTTVGQQHRHIDRDPARLMRRTANPAQPQRLNETAGQPSLIGKIGEQTGAGMPDHTPSPTGDDNLRTRAGTLRLESAFRDGRF